MNEQIKNTFLDFWGMMIGMLPKLLAAIVIFLVFFLIGHFLYKIFSKKFAEKWQETIVTKFLANVAKWGFYLIGLIAAVDILGFSGIMSSLIAGAGVTAIILGFAFKDIGENFLAGLLLAVNRPFRIGNIIEVGGFKGTVKGMDMRTTHIRNIEGKDIFIPNAMIVKNAVVNYTKDGLLRQQFMIGLDVPSNVPKAKALILGYLSNEPDILKKPEPNVLVADIGEFTIDIQVLFWVDVLKGKNQSPSYLGFTIRSKIIQEVKDLLLANGFNLPSKILEHKLYKEPIEIIVNRPASEQ